MRLSKRDYTRKLYTRSQGIGTRFSRYNRTLTRRETGGTTESSSGGVFCRDTLTKRSGARSLTPGMSPMLLIRTRQIDELISGQIARGSWGKYPNPSSPSTSVGSKRQLSPIVRSRMTSDFSSVDEKANRQPTSRTVVPNCCVHR